MSDCTYCGGSGLVRVHGAEDYGVSFECEACECPAGREHLDPLERAERAEAEVDRLRRENSVLRGSVQAARGDLTNGPKF